MSSGTKRPAAIREGEEFIICVGTQEVRKNHALLYYAYKLGLQKQMRLPRLIIVGREGWLTDDIRRMITTDPYVGSLITPMKDVGDEELTWLYQNALFAVFPSFYEGWGLPIAEAVHHGKLVLSSN
ncbi:glycosyltransferase family 1 protein, partial [Candidatus Saccharibacteria bacterium]